MNKITLKDKTYPFKEWIISTDEETGHLSAWLELVGDWQSYISIIRIPGMITYKIQTGSSFKLWPLILFIYDHHKDVTFNTLDEGTKFVNKIIAQYNKLLLFT